MENNDKITMVIHTSTIGDYMDVIRWALDQGMIWQSGGRDVKEYIWDEYKSEMCVVIRDKILTYCGKEFANLKTYIFDMKQFRTDIKNYAHYIFGLKYGLR